MTASEIKQTLKSAGLHLTIERDATSGHEFVVETADGQIIAYGWSGGTKNEAAQEALRHPAIQLKLRAVG